MKIDFEQHLKNVKEGDSEVYDLIKKEINRQETTLELIPSECATSPAVLEALGSVFTNKYSEGYPKARYYGGNQFVDEIEQLGRDRAKEIFGVPYVNMQPYSGSPANLAVHTAVCEPGDTTMGQALPDGGHLTHGWKASATSMFWNPVQYHTKEDGYLDLEEIERLAKEHKPKLIWVGATAYPREFPFEELSKIADEVGAYLVADTSHITGLIIAGVHKSPVPFVHIITSTTHKTLRGPRGGMIMVTQKGLDKDPDLGKKIDSAIFPKLQGGPHNHQIAGVTVALGEAMKSEFKQWGEQVVKNTKALAQAMMDQGLELITNGSDNHLVLMNCGWGRGVLMQEACDEAGMTLNKNTIPRDPASAFFPSGVRLGTPIMTTRGMKEDQMKIVGALLASVFDEVKEIDLPQGDSDEEKKDRREIIAKFKKDIKTNPKIKEVRSQVEKICEDFPLYK